MLTVQQRPWRGAARHRAARGHPQNNELLNSESNAFALPMRKECTDSRLKVGSLEICRRCNPQAAPCSLSPFLGADVPAPRISQGGLALALAHGLALGFGRHPQLSSLRRGNIHLLTLLSCPQSMRVLVLKWTWDRRLSGRSGI